MGGRRYCFSLDSFNGDQKEIIKMFMDHLRFQESPNSERALRVAQIDVEAFGVILHAAYEKASSVSCFSAQEEELPQLPGFYEGSLETPLKFSCHPAILRFGLEYMKPPVSKMLLRPMVVVEQMPIEVDVGRFFECAKPGMLHRDCAPRFPDGITRVHLRNLRPFRDDYSSASFG